METSHVNAGRVPRILFVTTVPITLASFLLPYAAHYRARGWRVEAAAAGLSRYPELQAQFDACHDLSLARSPWELAKMGRAQEEIRSLIRSYEYDLVHVHTPIASFLLRYALRMESTKPAIVYTAHGFHFHRGGSSLMNRLYRAIEKWAAPWCDALITINREDWYAARQAGFMTRLEYMPGIGIDTDSWSAEHVDPQSIEHVRLDLGITSEDALFLQVAEFNPGKRHEDAIHALASLDDMRAHLAFAGEGKRCAKMKHLAIELGLDRRVHFLGYRRDIPLLMRASRAVLLPSVREGLPRSLLEAMSLSVPIIVADIRGSRELATKGCGLIHPVLDVNSLAAAMRELLLHPDKARAMGERCRNKIVDYDIKRLLVLHDRLYADLMELYD